jgi:hypothetical protein
MFNGQSMTIIGEAKGGARRTLVDFDSSFTSCSAKASMGFESGKSYFSYSPIIHRTVEIKSAVTSGESCAIENSNLLGGPS